MNWKAIKLSEDMRSFYLEKELLFGRSFEEAMKFHDPGLAPVKDATGWYHIDINGNPAYKQRFQQAFGYYFHRASVIDGKGAYHILTDGTALYSDRHAWCGNFQEEICVIKNHHGYFLHIDLNGAVISQKEYIYAGDFKDGIACVRTPKGWTHIRIDNTEVHGQYYTGLGVYHKGIATAKDDQGWFHIDLKGVALYNERYHMVEPFYNGVALAWATDGSPHLLHQDSFK